MKGTSPAAEGNRARGVALVSVIVPALDEADAVPALLAALASQASPPPFEVILSDGDSRDDTIARFVSVARGALPAGAWSVVRSPRRGRAAQMNAGAAASRGEGLVFLHADTILPAAALQAVAGALFSRDAVGGGFRLGYREHDARLALIASWASVRSRLTGIHYGDQAMFVRREVFERIGGFPDVPLFEDRRLAARLRREGRVVTLPLSVRTSARRLLRGGIARTCLRFAWLKVRHAMGAEPADLAEDYGDVR